MKYLILIFTPMFLFVSCEDKKKTKTDDSVVGHEEQISKNQDLNGEDEINYWISEVDAEVENSAEVSYSLQFSNETEEVQVLVYHLNGIPVKLEEKFISYVNKTYGTRSYYLQNDQLVLSKEVKEEVLADSTYQMRETVSYYSNSIVKKSNTRSAPYEEDLIYEEFEPIELVTHPFDEALTILNNSGGYQVYFSDIMETSNATFLVLATNTPDKKMTTALMLEYRDEFANQILANKKKFKGKKVEISFEMVTSEGMTYQAYRGGKFVE